MIVIGDRYMYVSTQQDVGAPGHPERTGEFVTVLREIMPPERDEEVGEMYEVRFTRGDQKIHVFVDELV